MARADVQIFFSTSKPAFAYIAGAQMEGKASAVSASDQNNDIAVDATGAEITTAVGTVTAAVLTLSTVPDLNLSVGSTYDLSQYINDPNNEVTDSQILGLTGIATYSHATKLLTGVSDGALTGLQLEVTY